MIVVGEDGEAKAFVKRGGFKSIEGRGSLMSK